MPTTAPGRRPDDPTNGLLNLIVRLWYEDELSQAAIGQALPKYGYPPRDQSTVSRYLQRAKTEGIIRIHIQPPRLEALERRLKEKFSSKHLRDIVVVPGGSAEETLEHLGAHGAAILLDTLCSVMGPTIRLTLSCGTTVSTVVQQFCDRLRRAPEVRRYLQEKAWEIYPSHFLDEASFTNVHPLAQVATCASLLTVYLAPKGDIKSTVLNLPPRFYSRPPQARMQFLRQNPQFWESIRQAKAAEIGLVGVGNLWDESGHLQKRYAAVLQRLDPQLESTGEEYVAESDFIPLRADGTVHRCIANKVVGVGLKGFRHMLQRPAPPTIIAMAGGQPKRRAVAAALVKPYFNVLVTDETVARHLLQEPC